MSVDESGDKTLTPGVSSVQWRILNPNRPPGMPYLIPAHLFKCEKEEPNLEKEKPDGAYYYTCNSESNDNQRPRERFSVQSRLKRN